MPQIFYYLLKVIICSGILFGYYHLFLRNRIFHAYNRFYLLAAVLLSLSVPLLNFNITKEKEVALQQSVRILEAVNNSDAYLEEIIISNTRQNISGSEILLWIYGTVTFVLLGFFIHVLLRIFIMIKRSNRKKINDIIFITSSAKGTPFSFFKYLFWNPAIDINSETGNQVFAHEMAHITEQHSIDKLMINLILVLFWINPFFWLIRKELNVIHEFIADKKAVGNNNSGALAAMIIQAAYPQHTLLLTNQFFYSSIKRRIAMLSKYRSTRRDYIARIIALPVVIFLAAAFTLKTKESKVPFLQVTEKITVVIDAGHGGTDRGAMASDGTNEKDLTLALAKKIKELNKNENVEIILSRETDVELKPAERVQFAKNKLADMIVSVHLDNGPKGSENKKTGASVYIPKVNKNNHITSKTLASSVIQTFQQHYALPIQDLPVNRSIGIYVLDFSDCPAVIIEGGFINNTKDLAYLKSDEGQTRFATNVLNAIAAYAFEKNQTSRNSINPDKEIKSIEKDERAENIVLNQTSDKKNTEKVPIEKGVELYKTKIALISSSYSLYLLNGKQVTKERISSISELLISELEVLDAKRTMLKYGIKTEKGSLNIIMKPDPEITLSGIASSRIPIDQLKKITNLRSTHSGFKVKSATVYFAGTGFPEVVTASLSGESLEPIRPLLNKIQSGTRIIFDNIRMVRIDGTDEIIVKGKGVQFFDETPVTGILRVGINNPIGINSPFASDQLTLEISNGKIEKQDGKFFARVTKPGEVIISVLKDGKTIKIQKYKAAMMEQPSFFQFPKNSTEDPGC